MNDIQEGSNGTGSAQRSELLLLVGGRICGRGGKSWDRGITFACGLGGVDTALAVETGLSELLSKTAFIANEVVGMHGGLGWVVGGEVIVVVGVLGGLTGWARRRHRP